MILHLLRMRRNVNRKTVSATACRLCQVTLWLIGATSPVCSSMQYVVDTLRYRVSRHNWQFDTAELD